MNKQVDLFWDSWLAGVKKLNTLQEQFEKESLKTFGDVERFIKPTTKLFEKTHEKSVQLTEETYEQLKKSMIELMKYSDKATEATLLNDIEQISKQTQQLFWTSQKVLFDFLTASQVEASKVIESLINEQRNERTAILQKLTELVAEIKSMQKSTFPAK